MIKSIKHIATFTLAPLMILPRYFESASAASVTDVRANLTHSDYDASLKAGGDRGELEISYNASANKSADSMGVRSIAIYKSDGTYVTTVAGTTGNGLICKSSSSHTGAYFYSATSGVSYYAKVTFFATMGSTTDSQTVTTNTVKAP